MPSRYEPLTDNRRSIRLRGYDYTCHGAYAITVCIARRKRILGTVRCGMMYLSRAGELVEEAWHALPAHYPHLSLDAFVVMPNHVHGIVVVGSEAGWDGGRKCGVTHEDRGAGEVGAGRCIASCDVPTRVGRHALPEIVRAFKSFSARSINIDRNTPGARVWQRNYYERIIRDRRHLRQTRRYISENPAKWGDDRFH